MERTATHITSHSTATLGQWTASDIGHTRLTFDIYYLFC